MLLAQLRNLLRSNFLPGSSLADILVRNNNGLPVDMYEDCRSKKLKAVPKKEGLCECECERARQVECVQHNDSDGAAMASSSCAAVVSTLATTQCNGAPILATSVTTPTGCGLASSTLPGAGPSSGHSQAALKNEGAESMVDPLSVLSKAPHLIMQYHNEGSVSYILTLPAANARGGGGGVVVNGGGGGGPRLLPRAPSTNGLVSTSLRQLQPSPIPSPSQPSFPLQKKNSKVKRAQDATNTQREGILDRLQKAISGLVRPRAGKTQGQASSEESHGNSVASMPVDAVIALDQRSKNNNMEGTRTDAGGDDGNFSMGGRLDPDLFQVPLSWLSSPGGMAAPTAEASMEDVLAHPSEVATALHSNQLQQQQQQGQVEAGLGDDEGVASGRREEVIGSGSCFMDAYNLDFDSSALDSMLGAMEGGGGASESQCAPGVEILSSMEPMESDQGSQESLSSQPGACSSTETGDLLAASVPLETTCPSVSPLPPSAVPLRNSDVSCSSASSSSVWENLWQGESPGCGPTVAGVGMAPSSLPSGECKYVSSIIVTFMFFFVCFFFFTFSLLVQMVIPLIMQQLIFQNFSLPNSSFIFMNITHHPWKQATPLIPMTLNSRMNSTISSSNIPLLSHPFCQTLVTWQTQPPARAVPFPYQPCLPPYHLATAPPPVHSNSTQRTFLTVLIQPFTSTTSQTPPSSIPVAASTSLPFNYRNKNPRERHPMSAYTVSLSLPWIKGGFLHPPMTVRRLFTYPFPI